MHAGARGGYGPGMNAASPTPVRFDILDLAHDHLALQAEHLDLLAEELRLAQQALGEITGEFSADDLLGEIFSRFCIGK